MCTQIHTKSKGGKKRRMDGWMVNSERERSQSVSQVEKKRFPSPSFVGSCGMIDFGKSWLVMHDQDGEPPPPPPPPITASLSLSLCTCNHRRSRSRRRKSKKRYTIPTILSDERTHTDISIRLITITRYIPAQTHDIPMNSHQFRRRRIFYFFGRFFFSVNCRVPSSSSWFGCCWFVRGSRFRLSFRSFSSARIEPPQRRRRYCSEIENLFFKRGNGYYYVFCMLFYSFSLFSDDQLTTFFLRIGNNDAAAATTITTTTTTATQITP